MIPQIQSQILTSYQISWQMQDMEHVNGFAALRTGIVVRK